MHGEVASVVDSLDINVTTEKARFRRRWRVEG